MFYKKLFKKQNAIPKEIAARLFIGLITCSALIATIFFGRTPYGGQPQVGKVAERTVYASFDFSYETGSDIEKTDELKRTAALKVKDVYNVNPSVYTGIAQNIKTFFSDLKGIKDAPEGNLDEKPARLKAYDKLGISENSLKSLLQFSDADLEKIETSALDGLSNFCSQGVISREEKENLLKQEKSIITLRKLSAGAEPQFESEAEVKNLKTIEEAKSNLVSKLEQLVFDDKRLKNVLTEMASKSLVSNIEFDVVETSARREKAIATVPVQKRSIDVKKDELIIQKGERITPFHLAKLEAIRSKSLESPRFALSLLGIGVIITFLIVILSLYLAFYEPEIYANNKRLALLSMVIVLITLTGKATVLSKLPSYFIPVALGPMLIALLLGARPAVLMSIVISLLMGLVAGERFDLTFIFLTGSIIGIYAVRSVRKRSQLFMAGVFVGLTSAFCVIGLGILNNFEFQTILYDAIWFFINGLAVGAIITGTLHIFESISQITTNITLLELADPNNPLLKELILKAPGTYHHSLIVGNLAETACETIGANGLLARVGAYYHDIGKVEKAEYFAENQPVMESQHDKLEPSMSSLIIISHVKEGIEKARKNKLNKILLDFIEQHHGTGLIYYFYQRALESVEDVANLGEEGFRYPGPKPQTKETAIVHLADSVEAASRTLKNPTPANLEDLVRRIINNKFIDGQLDECDLTLKDLNSIATAFTKVLTGVYHTRVQYPDEEKDTES